VLIIPGSGNQLAAHRVAEAVDNDRPHHNCHHVMRNRTRLTALAVATAATGVAMCPSLAFARHSLGASIPQLCGSLWLTIQRSFMRTVATCLCRSRPLDTQACWRIGASRDGGILRNKIGGRYCRDQSVRDACWVRRSKGCNELRAKHARSPLCR